MVRTLHSAEHSELRVFLSWCNIHQPVAKPFTCNSFSLSPPRSLDDSSEVNPRTSPFHLKTRIPSHAVFSVWFSGHYMYVDSVYIKHFQEVAQLISPMTTAPMSGCLSFYYQLQQGNDNVFSLYTRDVTGLYEEIWKTNSPESPAWNLAEVEFNAPYPMEVGVPGVP